jgi:hypothetical protein
MHDAHRYGRLWFATTLLALACVFFRCDSIEAACTDADIECNILSLTPYYVNVQRHFVATAANKILISEDGVNWTLAPIVPTAAFLRDAAYGAGVYVVVGDTGTVLYSYDRATWIAANSGTATNLTGVAFGAGRFVVSGQSGVALVSTDGIHWSLETSAAGVSLQPIRFGAGLFAANRAGDPAVFYTATGRTGEWNTFNMSSIAFGFTAAFANERWVFGTTGTQIEVYNANFSAQLAAHTGIVGANRGVHAANNFFFALEPGSSFSRSAIAVDDPWLGGSTGCLSNLASEDMVSIAYGNGVYIMAGDDASGFGAICRSFTGEPGSFQRIGTPDLTGQSVNNVEFIIRELRPGLN